MSDLISENGWRSYEDNGYLRLGQVLKDQELARLQQRIDDIMLGRAEIDFKRLMMQLDSQSGKYNEAGEQTRGWKGATLNYRKIQDLEYDPLFRAYLEAPLFKEVCERVYGEAVPIACFRAMFMNKPAHQGTLLPWHQDAWAHLDRQPLITVWTALDPATIANGCVEIIKGSHKFGRLNPDHPSGFLTGEQIEQICSAYETEYLELEAGEAVLLHNWLLHRSDVNKTEISRRAFSVCYMDGRTKAANGESFTLLFNSESLVA